MMHMVKVSAEPKNAMMTSNEGMRMAIRIMMMLVTMRMVHLRIPRVYPERPTSCVDPGTVRGCNPQKISVVTTIGRVLD